MAVARSITVGIIGDNKNLKQALKDSKTDTQKLGSEMKGVFRGVKLVVGTLTLAIGAMVKTAISLNSEMANVSSLISGNMQRTTDLKSQIQDLSKELGIGTTDLAKGLYQTISAYGDTEESIDSLALSAKVGVAGVATTADAVDLLSSVTAGYGDTSLEAQQKAADFAFTTVELGKTTIPELARSLGRVVPLAAELGVTQEELFAIMATGTTVSGNSNRTATETRGVLQALLAPTDSLRGLMDDLGVADGNAMIKKYGLVGSMEQIIKRTKETGEPVQRYIGSIEGMNLALLLTGGQADNYALKLGLMNESQGATDRAFEAQTQGINDTGFAMKQLQTTFEVASQQIGDIFLPYIGEKIANLLPSIQSILDKAIEVLPGTIKWFQDMGTDIKDVFDELKPVIDEFKKGFKKATDENKEDIKGLKDAAVDLKDSVKLAWSEMFKAVSDNSGFIGPVVEELIGLILINWQSVMDTMSGVLKFITGVFTGDWDLAWEGLKQIVVTWVNGVIGLLNSVIGLINNLIEGINKIPAVNIGTIPDIPKIGSSGQTPPAPIIDIPTTPAYMVPPKRETTNVFNITSPAPLDERETARQVGKVQSAFALEAI